MSTGRTAALKVTNIKENPGGYNVSVVVTGATGLIGSALLAELKDKCQIHGLTRGETRENLLHTDYSIDSLTDAFQGANVIVHLAAIRGKGNDYQHFIDNAVLTENILKAAIIAKTRKVIYMSSIAAYSDQGLLPWKEDQPVQPQTFYGLSKITGEHLCQLYGHKDLDFTIFRCGIVLGITKNNRMTDIFIQKAAAGEPITVKGKSIARRDFVYLKDVVGALCWGVMEDQSHNQIYNLGSGEAHTNLEVAEATNLAFGNEGNLIYQDDCAEGLEDSRMDSSKLESAGFRCNYNLASALKDIRNDWGKQ